MVLNAMPPGVYTRLDSFVLASFALSWAMLFRAQASIHEHGELITTVRPIVSRATGEPLINNETGEPFLSTEIEINPAVKVWKAANESLLKASDRLGLSPGVRSRLGIGEMTPNKPQSRYAGLLGGSQASAPPPR